MILSFFLLLGLDDESPRSNVVQSTRQDPDDIDSGLIEGSETEEDVEFSHSDEEDVEFSHSDEEDVGINGQATSEDSVHLRFVNVFYPFSFSCGIVKSSFERR